MFKWFKKVTCKCEAFEITRVVVDDAILELRCMDCGKEYIYLPGKFGEGRGAIRPLTMSDKCEHDKFLASLAAGKQLLVELKDIVACEVDRIKEERHEDRQLHNEEMYQALGARTHACE